MNYNKFIEEKILKLSSKKNYEKYPNQMKQSLQEQVTKYNLEIVLYNKNYYSLTAILKDKQEDNYIGVVINDLSCFEDRSYSCVALRIMKNINDRRGIANKSCCWNDIGRMSRKLLDLKKQREAEVEEEIER